MAVGCPYYPALLPNDFNHDNMKAPTHIQDLIEVFNNLFELQMMDLSALDKLESRKYTASKQRGVKALKQSIVDRARYLKVIDSDIFNFSLREITNEYHDKKQTA